MDLFSILRNNLSPSKKMVLAINSDDLQNMEEVLQSGFDVNSKLLEQGGDRALHLACGSKKPSIRIIEKLSEFKADFSLKNDFGFLPIHRALSSENVEVVKYLLKNHNTDNDCEVIHEYWHFCLTEENPHRQMIPPDMVTLMLIAIPYFLNYSERTQELIFNNASACDNFTSMKLMLISGKKLIPELLNEDPITDEEIEYNEWVENFKLKNAPPLQHISRMTLRKSINNRYNVIYAVEKLDLPKSLKQFLKFNDVTPCGL